MTDKKNYFIDARQYIMKSQPLLVEKITRQAHALAQSLGVTEQEYIASEIDRETWYFLKEHNEDPTIAAIELFEPDLWLRKKRIRDHQEYLLNIIS